ncbi:MAG: hypothetical protein ACOC80_07540 [Petrotogales bacterium]
MKEEEKAYIREIVREAVKELKVEFPCKENTKAISKMWTKLFNGLEAKLNVVIAVVGILLTGILGMAIYIIRSVL